MLREATVKKGLRFGHCPYKGGGSRKLKNMRYFSGKYWTFIKFQKLTTIKSTSLLSKSMGGGVQGCFGQCPKVNPFFLAASLKHTKFLNLSEGGWRCFYPIWVSFEVMKKTWYGHFFGHLQIIYILACYLHIWPMQLILSL